MYILNKKPVAALIMSLVISASLILIARTPAVEALIVCGILLAVCILVDLVAGAKTLTKMQSRLAAIAIGGTAIVGIVIFGVATGLAMPDPDPDVASSPSPSASQDVEPPTSTSPETTEGDEKPTDEMYELGLFYYEREEYEKAIQTLDKVKDTSDFYADAMKLRAEVADGYRTSLADTAKTYVDKGDYKLAIDILNAGLLVIPKDAELLQTIETYSLEYANLVRTAAITEAETFAAAQDYANALVTIQGAIDEVGGKVELQTLYDYYTNQFRDMTLAEARQVYAEQGYDPSLSIFQDSLAVLPDDEILMAYYDVFLSHKPAQLSNLVEIDRSDSHYDTYEHNNISDLLGSDPIDSDYSFGNDNWSGYSSGTGWVEYFLNKEYVTFQCSFLTRSIKPTYTFCVYGDDAELYNSGEISWEAGRQNINVNVRNINKLTILVKWSGGETFDYGRFFMGNDLLYQELTDDDFAEIRS